MIKFISFTMSAFALVQFIFLIPFFFFALPHTGQLVAYIRWQAFQSEQQTSHQ